jgi:hypothetical protein
MDVDNEKRVPIKLRPVNRKHGGKITEPYRIMERLLKDCDEFEPIRHARIRMYWRKDWQADVDGVIVGAQCAKASDRDRLLAEDGGDGVDFFIMLPEKAFPKLDDTKKEHRIYHELCHLAPSLDSNGDQKLDEKDRPMWRLKRHPIAAFPTEVERYGVDHILGHNDQMVEDLESSNLPLFADQDKEEGGPKNWRSWAVADHLNITTAARTALEKAGLDTLGKLSEKMNALEKINQMIAAAEGPWEVIDAWYEGVPGIGPGQAEKIGEAFEAFWLDHPEAAEAG